MKPEEQEEESSEFGSAYGSHRSNIESKESQQGLVIELKDLNNNTERDQQNTFEDKADNVGSDRNKSLQLMSRNSSKANNNKENSGLYEKRDSEDLLVIKENKF